ncbi:MAG: acetylxylan esterase [Planctomycetales bacterium]|nr:acetylxylan esterase [Planctomycetales bacterium]
MSLLRLCIVFIWTAMVGVGYAQQQQAELPIGFRDLESHCPFQPPLTLAAWQQRAGEVRLQLSVALGLYPKPLLDEVKPKIYGAVDRDEYTIEKVTFESLPGFFVTGNLYRPKNIQAGTKIPAVLCPHGHWTEARFYNPSQQEINDLLAIGAERFETAARNHIQARCVQLARMGCIVFHWDMIGYCDSQQINFSRAHTFAKQDAATENNEQGWLLYSPLAEANCQTIIGLQSLATQRAVDMLLTLPEVDATRIAITGASGGGTQTFLGAALDDRISVAFPAVMVSTGMQGGCTCENAPLLRNGTGNVEIAALIAPRPLGMSAADDWTRTMPEDGFPELQKLYSLFGAKDKVALFPALHFKHNYNHVSRVNMYGWMSDHLGLGFKKPILERDFELAAKEELSVWDAEHPQPEGGEVFERQLLSRWAKIVDAQLQGLLQGDQNQQRELSKVLHSGWRTILGLTAAAVEPAQLEAQGETIAELSSQSEGTWEVQQVLVKEATADQVVITHGGNEKAIAITILPQQNQTLVQYRRLAAGYTYGYNMAAFSKQARQIAATIGWLRHQYPGEEIQVSGHGPGAALSAAAALCAADQTRSEEEAAKLQLQLWPEGFDFRSVSSIQDNYFLPGALRFWDFSGLSASIPNAVVHVHGSEPTSFVRLEKMYGQQGSELHVAQ